MIKTPANLKEPMSQRMDKNKNLLKKLDTVEVKVLDDKKLQEQIDSAILNAVDCPPPYEARELEKKLT